MYITRKEVLDLRNEVQTELEEFEYGRAKKHIYNIQGEDRIMLLYVIDLLDKILKMLERGEYYRSRILDALQSQDWVWYSYNKKALYSEKLLKKRFNMKETKKIKYMNLICKQAGYLQNASAYIVQRLE